MYQDNPKEMAFVVNFPKLVTETINGEAIIVHLDSGAYYSLCDSACFLWERLQTGSSVSRLAAQIRGQYTGVEESLEVALGAFIADLQADGLVLLTPEPLVEVPFVSDSEVKQPFTHPVIEKFTDMADLLMLDVIHDVAEEEGWPFKKQPKSS